jgi:hypothetical protein
VQSITRKLYFFTVDIFEGQLCLTGRKHFPYLQCWGNYLRLSLDGFYSNLFRTYYMYVSPKVAWSTYLSCSLTANGCISAHVPTTCICVYSLILRHIIFKIDGNRFYILRRYMGYFILACVNSAHQSTFAHRLIYYVQTLYSLCKYIYTLIRDASNYRHFAYTGLVFV